MQSTNQIRCGW